MSFPTFKRYPVFILPTINDPDFLSSKLRTLGHKNDLETMCEINLFRVIKREDEYEIRIYDSKTTVEELRSNPKFVTADSRVLLLFAEQSANISEHRDRKFRSFEKRRDRNIGFQLVLSNEKHRNLRSFFPIELPTSNTYYPVTLFKKNEEIR